MWLSKRCYVKVFVDGVVMCLFLRFPEGGEEADVQFKLWKDEKYLVDE